MSGILQALLAGAGAPPVPPELVSFGHQMFVETFPIYDIPAKSVVILAVGAGRYDPGNVDFSVTSTSGAWTKISDLYANDTLKTHMAVFYKVFLSASEEEEITVSDQPDVLYYCGSQYGIFTGVDLNNPLVGTAQNATGINSANAQAPAIEVPSSAVILSIVSSVCLNNTNLVPPAATSGNLIAYDGWGVPTGDMVWAHAMGLYDSGLSGTPIGTWTRSGSTNTDSWAATTIGLRAA